VVSELRSVADPRLRAIVVDRRSLRFEGEPAWPHVRAASAVVRRQDRLLVVQDDALILAEVGAGIVALPLPALDGRRLFDARDDTKRFKPDLEAAVGLDDGRIVLFGSGSTDARERLYAIDGEQIDVVAAPRLYAALRTALGPDVALNVEGAMIAGKRLVLLQRGNGAGAVDAELAVPLDWLVGCLAGKRARGPRVAVRRWDLGTLDGARLSFTDGVALGPRTFLYTASAEASPNVVDDGIVSGSAIGSASDRGGHWAPLVGTAGELLRIKAEGLAPGERADEWMVTTDPDDVDTPSELLTVRLEGPWQGIGG
jgi:hypothetical protein